MYIYNTTFGIEPSAESEFIAWLRDVFIPTATDVDSSSSYFSSPEILRVHGTDHDTVSIALHLRAESLTDIDDWYSDHGSRLFSHILERWAGKVVFFTTTLESLG